MKCFLLLFKFKQGVGFKIVRDHTWVQLSEYVHHSIHVWNAWHVIKSRPCFIEVWQIEMFRHSCQAEASENDHCLCKTISGLALVAFVRHLTFFHTRGCFEYVLILFTPNKSLMLVAFLTGGSNASLSKALKHCMVSVATFAMDLYFWPESFRSFRSELAELFLPLSTDACMEDFHDLILKISCGGTGNKSGTSASGMANVSLFHLLTAMRQLELHSIHTS